MFALAMFLSAGQRALAQDDPLLDSAAPMRWRAALLPEEGAELELPEYYGPLDRARAYVHAGRYKRAIHELTGKDAPDAEAGLVLAEANLRLGRYDEAAAAVDDPAEPAAVVMAARIEMERGQPAKAARARRPRLPRPRRRPTPIRTRPSSGWAAALS